MFLAGAQEQLMQILSLYSFCFQTITNLKHRTVQIPSLTVDQIPIYLYFTCKYIFQLSHHLKLIKEFLHLVISHLQVVRTVIGIKITIKNFMLWFHYLCQMSYINHELWYSQACVNMHPNKDHEVFTDICNSRLNFHKHLRIQARTQLCERVTGALVLSESKVSVPLTFTHLCVIDNLPLSAQLKHELREGDGTNPTPF